MGLGAGLRSLSSKAARPPQGPGCWQLRWRSCQACADLPHAPFSSTASSEQCTRVDSRAESSSREKVDRYSGWFCGHPEQERQGTSTKKAGRLRQAAAGRRRQGCGEGRPLAPSGVAVHASHGVRALYSRWGRQRPPPRSYAKSQHLFSLRLSTTHDQAATDAELIRWEPPPRARRGAGVLLATKSALGRPNCVLGRLVCIVKTVAAIHQPPHSHRHLLPFEPVQTRAPAAERLLAERSSAPESSP